MSRQAITINLTAEDFATLKAWSRSNILEHRIVQRALIILAAAEGAANRDIGVRYNVKASTVSTWRKRFAERGLNGLDDAPRSGKPVLYDKDTEKRILAKLDEAPPP